MDTQQKLIDRMASEIIRVIDENDLLTKAAKIGKIRFRYNNLQVRLAARAAAKNNRRQLHALSVALWSLAQAVHGHVSTIGGIHYVQ